MTPRPINQEIAIDAELLLPLVSDSDRDMREPPPKEERSDGLFWISQYRLEVMNGPSDILNDPELIKIVWCQSDSTR